MFKWLTELMQPKVHVFGDAQEAWTWACENQKNRFLVEAVIAGLVVESLGRNPDGGESFRLRLAAPHGGRDFVASTLPGVKSSPEPGDLVSFKVVMIRDDLPEDVGVVGYIEAKLEPVYVGRKGWKMAKSYIPGNLKPQFRL